MTNRVKIGSDYLRFEDTTSNGIRFYSYLINSDGAGFILYPIKGQHKTDDINFAKRELRNQRDVVSLKIEKCDSYI